MTGIVPGAGETGLPPVEAALGWRGMGDGARRPGWEARARLPSGRRGQGGQGGFSVEGPSEVSLESRVPRQDGRAVENRDLQGRPPP